MSNSIGKPSVRQQARGLLERIESLEAQVADLNQSIIQVTLAANRAVGKMNQQISMAVESLNAVIRVVGEDPVTEAQLQIRKETAAAQEEARKQEVVKALENGKIEVEPTVRDVTFSEDKKSFTDPGSYVAFVDIDSEGAEVPYSYRCISLSKLGEEERNKVIGKSVGLEILDSPILDDKGQPALVDGLAPPRGKTVIIAVYRNVPPKPVEETKAEAPAAEAAPVAETPAAVAETPVAVPEAPVAE